MAVQEPPHSRDRATNLELAADQRSDTFQSPPLIFPAMRGRTFGQLIFQHGEPRVRQLRQFRGSLRLQTLHTAFTPVAAPLLHRTLAHPQVLGDDRIPVTSSEPLPGLQPDPFTRSPPLSSQAPTIRVPHSTGIPQGSPNVTTRRQPERSVTPRRTRSPRTGMGGGLGDGTGPPRCVAQRWRCHTMQRYPGLAGIGRDSPRTIQFRKSPRGLTPAATGNQAPRGCRSHEPGRIPSGRAHCVSAHQPAVLVFWSGPEGLQQLPDDLADHRRPVDESLPPRAALTPSAVTDRI